MAVKMSMFVFWALMPCGLVVKYHEFGGTLLPQSSGLNFLMAYSKGRLKSTDDKTFFSGHYE
jgi:hypothetical protein